MAVVRARRQGNIILIVVVIVRVGVNALVDGRALNARIEEPIETSIGIGSVDKAREPKADYQVEHGDDRNAIGNVHHQDERQQRGYGQPQ